MAADDVNIDQIAEAVAAASDEELLTGLEVNRELVLEEIFRRMPSRLDRERAARVRASIEWRITGRAGGGSDRYRVLIADGRCEVVRPDDDSRADVLFEIAPLDFLKLVTGNVAGPLLFMTGRLKVRGDLLLAARVPALFSLPGS